MLYIFFEEENIKIPINKSKLYNITLPDNFEIHNNILIVKRTDSSYGWVYNHTVEILENI